VARSARACFTLDDVGILDQAERHPEALLSSRPVTLDEVQRAPPMLLAVKRAVDERRRAGDFLLTGSANLLLMGRVADTLAGRAIYLELPPFCPAEWQQGRGALSPLDRLFAPDFDFREWPAEPGDWPAWLLRGGFPPALAIAADSDRALWFSAYVQTYLERDLRQLSAVSSLPDFQRMMALAAHRTGRLLNQADLARDAALTHPTAHRYLNLLEAGCLVTRIRPLATNPNVALVKTPKLLWTDCGLAASLAGIRAPTEATSRPDAGFWLEQTLFQTLQTWRALDPLQDLQRWLRLIHIIGFTAAIFGDCLRRINTPDWAQSENEPRRIHAKAQSRCRPDAARRRERVFGPSWMLVFLEGTPWTVWQLARF